MNEELKMIQDEINRCVYETFNGVSGYDGFSIPCIPRISSQYLKNRFVILAQETNTWYPNVGHFQDLASSKYCNLEKILYENCYDDFCQWASETYKGAFWDFSRFLYSDEGVLCGPIHQDKYLTHCWMNLFCIEKCRNKRDRFGRPSQNRNLAEFIVKIQKDLVFKILKIIKPKTILAMTGYQNDSFLIENGLGTSFDRVDFYYNGVTAYDGIVNIGYLTHQLPLLPAHAQYNPNILINNKIISTSRHGTGGNAPNISVYNGYNAKTFPPGIYYCTVTSHTATNGKQYTCEGSFEISTNNCVINLSFSYEDDDDILTSTYLYNTSVPISNALMGLVNAQTNALITTATTNSNGQIQWNVGDGVYKVVAINVDNEYILSSEIIDLTSEYELIRDISLNENDNFVIKSVPSISIKEPTDLVTNVALDDDGNIVVEKNTFNPGDNTENVISKIYIDANNRLIAETYNIYTNDIVLDSTKNIIQKNETTKLTATVLDKINQTTLPNKTVNFYSE